MSYFFNEDSTASRMLALIERCAPRMMRCGGGGITQQCQVGERAAFRRLSAEQRAHVESVITPDRTMMQAASEAGVSINTIRRFAERMGVTLKNGRRGVAIGTKRRKAIP